MTGRRHIDLGGFVLGTLSAEEHERFERHLAGCRRCRDTVARLRPIGALAGRLGPGPEPPLALEARTLAAVELEAGLGGRADADAARRLGVRRRRGKRVPRPALAAGLIAALAAAIAVSTLVADDRGPAVPHRSHQGIDGDRLPILLAARDGGRPHAHASITRTRDGAIVTFHSDHLPPPPPGNAYELWLVGPGDAPGRPNRISAGWFRPDAKGTTFVDLAAPAPDRFPVVAITLEPSDGDPSPTAPDIARSDWSRAAGGTVVRLFADAFRQPDGRALRLLLTHRDPERSTPPVRELAVVRPPAIDVAAAPRGSRIGALLFSLGDTAPRNRRTVPLALTRSDRRAQIVGRAAGTRVRWAPAGRDLLTVRLPDRAINPRINLTGRGARLLRLRACESLRLTARWTEADRSSHRQSHSISPARLKRAGFC